MEQQIMRLLKVHEVKLLLYKTPLGELEKKFGKEGEITYTLDAVPVTKELQKELSKIYG